MKVSHLLDVLEDQAVAYDCSDSLPEEIDQVASLDQAQAHEVAFYHDPRRKHSLQTTQAGLVILSSKAADLTDQPKLIVDDPYYVYALVAQALNPFSFSPGVSEKATVVSSASVAPSAYIGPNAVIEADVVIESDCYIDAGVVIKAGAFVGAGTVVCPNVVIGKQCEIGQQCYLDAGCVIGGEGFGFAPHQGRWQHLPQLGRVVIGERVFVGNNTTIHRGALDDTVVASDCILDAQVQVAHNVTLGPGTAAASLVGFSGSAQVGAHCTFAGQAGVAGHLQIADHVHIGGKGGVTGSIRQPGHYAGFPAIEAGQWQKNMVRLKSIDKMANKIKSLEKKLQAMEATLDKNV